MSSKDPVVGLMRLMTHVNVGAALGLVAWTAWSGWQVVSGQLGTAPVRPTTLSPHLVTNASPMRLVPVSALDPTAARRAHCAPAEASADAGDTAAVALLGTDL